MLDLIDITPTGKLIAQINGKLYMLRRWEHGTWRSVMVQKDTKGFYFVCDDDDWIILDGRIIGREIGWDLRRENEGRTNENE